VCQLPATLVIGTRLMLFCEPSQLLNGGGAERLKASNLATDGLLKLVRASSHALDVNGQQHLVLSQGAGTGQVPRLMP
jgi:hypothetical protein